MTQFRDCALYGRIPSMHLALRGWLWAAVMLVIGLYEFRKNQDRFILYL